MKVPEDKIQEAIKRGLTQGKHIKCAVDGAIGIIGPVDQWNYTSIGGWLKVGEDDNDRALYAYNGKTWATVITAASDQGLVEGDAVECSATMLAAIIELAKELGLEGTPPEVPVSGYPHLVWDGVAIGDRKAVNSTWAKVWMTPEAFMAKMRVTAAKPKPIKDCSFRLSYEKGSVKIGDVLLSNDMYRSISKGLID